ncbi:cupin domain-containing protein [Sporomusa acidovorans]|uniref:Ethanolamine utilization protein EutQ n=1 Tax=Sporomusa acidovorans (strain ATCC 49682 / DSM 3132 / Mol) TaxID=1123286 RepID=A0ABZ3J874_SPOA4|nr:cupin domain-containing protein [Sporomusa acidovorans]OZC17504.1 ethanolamine utilization protein EutQ [Sporomusa acidovorans DSM 3132]SDF07765.1 ethanolamine utilization protein EutQ [Sporomusa acidovorans]
MKKLISAVELRRLAETGKDVIIPSQSVLTPSAKDMAKELGVRIVREQAVNRLSDKQKQREAGKHGSTEIQSKPDSSQSTLEVQVRNIVTELMKPACAQPKMTQVKGSEVELRPFEAAPSDQKVKLKDVITAREANLAAGFMSFDHAKFPWNLTYDEVDYVIEGTFTVASGGKTYTCVAGDVLYIPKDTQVVFGSPDKAKVFYVTYPANWSDI